MRKILLACIASVGLMLSSYAQDFGFEKGDFLLEGGLNATSSTKENTNLKKSNFSIMPLVGYFVSDKWALGMGLGFDRSKEDMQYFSDQIWTIKSNSYRVSGFGRYYILQVGSRFFAYTQGNIGYNHWVYDHDQLYNFPDLKVWNASIGIGANFFLTKKIAVGYNFANLLAFSSVKFGEEGSPSKRFHANINSFSNFFDSGNFSLTFRF